MCIRDSDEVEPPQTEEKWAIHRPAPSFEEQATSQEMLETGIKVVDLLCPYQKLSLIHI